MAFWGKKDDEDKKNQAAFSFATTGQTAPSSTQNPIKEPTPFSPPSLAQRPAATPSPTTTAAQAEEQKIRSALGPGTVIHGKLSFDAPVSIDGKLSGEIFSSKTLHVGKSGTIDATIEVAALVVRGIVKGSIKATERVEIRDGGQILGDVSTPILIMDDGCIFHGSCTMPQSASKKILEVRKEASVG